MTFSIGIAKRVAYKKETTWGTIAGTPSSGSRAVRRVTSSFNLAKEAFESAEIRTDYQIADFRHGVRSAEGTLSGELSPGTYQDFIGSVVGRNFTNGVSLTGLTYSVAVNTAPTPGFRITRTAGDFISGGIKVGDVVRITAAGGNANNTGRNLLVFAVATTTLDVVPLNGGSMNVESNIASATIAVIGSKTFAPLTNHTDDSYTIEEWFSDIGQSERYVGMKVNTASFSLPATGLTTCEFGFMGRDIQTGTSEYFTNVTPLNSSGIFAAVNGVLLINGVPQALLTGLNININRNMQQATVVGSNSIAELFEGRVSVEGDFSAYFGGPDAAQRGALRDIFLNETEVSLVVALSESNAPNAGFVSITLPRIKINSNTKDDGETGIVAQHSFRALLPGPNVTTVDRSTIVVQDSNPVV